MKSSLSNVFLVAAVVASFVGVVSAASAIAAGDVTWPVVYCEHVSSRLCLVDREAGVGGSERVVAPLGGGVVLCAEEACAILQLLQARYNPCVYIPLPAHAILQQRITSPYLLAPSCSCCRHIALHAPTRTRAFVQMEF